MGTIEDKLKYLNTTKIKLKDSINLTGANITNDTTFRNYSIKLKENLVNILKGNIWDLFDNFDTVEDSGEEVFLNNSYDETIMKIDLKGNTKQDIIEADEGITLSDTLVYANNVNTGKEHTIELSGNTYQDVIMEEEGTKVSNTKIYVNDIDVNKEHTIELSGNTYQNSTTGKNILYNDSQYNYTSLGVSGAYDKSDGSFTITGKATGGGNAQLTRTIPLELAAGTYTFSMDHALSKQIYLHFNLSNNQSQNILIAAGETSATGTFDISTTGYNIRFSVVNDTTYDEKVRMQLESGSTATSYELYTHGAAPNLDYPQTIEVVTGEQNIKIEGKNKCDYISNIIASAQGLTSTVNSDGSITTAGKPTSNYTKITQVINIIDNLKDNTYYTISQSASNNYLFIQMNIRAKSGTYTYLNAKTGSVSFLVDKSQYDKYEITIQTTTTSAWGSSSRTITNSYQLEEGQTATTFEPYHLQSYSVNLGKNLFNPQYEVETQYNTGGSTVTPKYSLSSGTITIANSDTQAGRYFFNKLFLGAGTYTLSWTPSVSGTNKKMNYSVRNLNSLTDIIVDTRIDIVDGTRQNISFTLDEDQSISFSLQPATVDSGTLTLENIQLEKGSIATTYTEYFTPIELCKIDTYQDRIYKEKEKWYLEKKVNKIFLTSNGNLFRTATSTTGYYRFTMDIGDNIYTTDAPTDVAPFYCNKFIPGSRGNSYNLIDCVYPSTSSFSYKSFGFYCKETKEMTVEECQTWLSQKDIVVYYPYATSIKTEITNSTLINQLETLYNADLYSAVDIETQTNDLLPYIDLHYNFVFPEPTPDTQKNIDIVIGTQNINITGKNLLPYPYEENATKTMNGVTFTPQEDGSVLVNGTASGGNANIKLYGKDYLQRPIIGNYLSGGTSSVRIRALNNTDGHYTVIANDTGSGASIDKSTFDICYVELTVLNGTTVNNATIKPMILNSLDNITYEPYTNTTYSIDLPVENLFDHSQFVQNESVNGITASIDNGYLKLSGTPSSANDSISKDVSITDIIKEFGTATFNTTVIDGTYPYTFRVYERDENNTIVNRFNGLSRTLTYTENHTYSIRAFVLSDTSLVNIDCSLALQIEEGSTANKYVPYGTSPIKLCKIGTYQDKIYKQNGKWYLYKTIDKIILDGSENWDKSNVAGNTKTQRFSFSMAKAHVNDVGFCKQFIVKSSDVSVYSDKELFQLASSASNKYTGIQINIDRLSENTVAAFKTWLSAHNITTYYVLLNPVTTEITDTTLISQLEALYNATIYPITNINTDTGNLLPYIDLHYNFVTPSPSPNRPSNVNVVKGNNTINIHTKNLFDYDNILPAAIGSRTFVAYDNTTKILTLTNYSSDSYFPALYTNAPYAEGINVTVKPNTKYTFSFKADQPGSSLKISVFGLKSNNTYTNLMGGFISDTHFTFDSGQYTQVAFRIGSTSPSETITNFTDFQLEEGEAVTEYAPYQIQTYSINLPVENLFDKDNANIFYGFISSATVKASSSSLARTLYIPCKPYTTYTISKIASSRFQIGTTEISPENNTTIIDYVAKGENSTFGTITTSSTARYLLVYYYLSGTDTLTEQEILDSIQIEEGSAVNNYTSYGTTPIELCKIGNYQDCFYEDNGKWYLEKKIDKKSDNSFTAIITITSTLADNLYGYACNTQGVSSYSELGAIISNIFAPKILGSQTDTTNPNNVRFNMGIAKNPNNSQVVITIDKKYLETGTTTEFSNFLNDNNFEYYCVLATPIDTQITDSTLINQLNLIKNSARSYDNQTNITQENANVPFIITAEAIDKTKI